uniref:Uncharacterized protein n=1 Tax=Anguilla anguilla TaxID=7936 RepID=A0A0E9TW53_ANGAN
MDISLCISQMLLFIMCQREILHSSTTYQHTVNVNMYFPCPK